MQGPPTWATAVDHAELELKSLRQRLEAPEQDAIATALLRGEIRALKRLIALPETAARKAVTAAQLRADQ